MSRWWRAIDGVARGNLTLGEAHELVLLDIAETVGRRVHDARRSAEFARDRLSVPVPKTIGELELLIAVGAAVAETNAYWRAHGERNGNADGWARLYDRVTFPAVAAALVGVPIRDEWKVRYARRVVPPLGRLVAAGLLCRGEGPSGQPYGYELTPDGEAMLAEAGAIDALAEAVA